jgi:hypothetical protein
MPTSLALAPELLTSCRVLDWHLELDLDLDWTILLVVQYRCDLSRMVPNHALAESLTLFEVLKLLSVRLSMYTFVLSKLSITCLTEGLDS